MYTVMAIGLGVAGLLLVLMLILATLKFLRSDEA